MKKAIYTFLLLGFSHFLLAQDEEEPFDIIQTNWFTHFSFGVNAINANPATLEFSFVDDAEGPDQDSVGSTVTTDGLWAYGLGIDVIYLLPKNFTIGLDNFVGWGSDGDFFNYVGHLRLGYEYETSPFYIQPSIGIGYIHSTYTIDEYFSPNKGYFEVDNQFIEGALKARLTSDAFSISPAVKIEYPFKNVPSLSLFARGRFFYTFGRRSSILISGSTDEVDEDGDAVTARSRRNFVNNGATLFINGTQIVERNSPFLHYNFNNILVQVGVVIRIGVVDEDF